MTPQMVIVMETNHPFLEERLYTFREFEDHARIAAAQTPPRPEPFCTTVSVLFHTGDYIDLHLHLARNEDFGILDRIGTLLGRAMVSEDVADFLAHIHKTIH